MTRNSLNDPKVRSELGVWGATKGGRNHLELLGKDYLEGALKLSTMGLNSKVFDLRLPRVEEIKQPEGHKARI